MFNKCKYAYKSIYDYFESGGADVFLDSLDSQKRGSSKFFRVCQSFLGVNFRVLRNAKWIGQTAQSILHGKALVV